MKLILEVVGDPFGFAAVLCVCVALTSLGMMFASAARSGASRRLSATLLLAAAAYAALNAGLITVMLSSNSFAIFRAPYMVAVGVLAPALAIAFLLLVPKASRNAAGLLMVGFGGWVLSVSVAHLWVVLAAAASV